MRALSTVVFLIYLLYAEAKKNKGSDNDNLVEQKGLGLGRGFGDDIKWVPWDGALSTAKLLKKPVFLLIHKTWCGACKALKGEFKSSQQRDEFVKLSKKFVMVNTEDDEEPADERYIPDGGYIPRLFFLNTNGDVLEGTENSNYPSNKHYFPRLPNIIEKMKYALEVFGTPLDDVTDKKKATKKSTKKESEKQKEEKDDKTDDDKEGKREKERKAKEGKSQGTKKSKDEKKRKSEL